MSFVMNLANWTERFSTPAERFFLGVTMTLVGLTIVLLVLSLISLMVSAISRVIRGKSDKRIVLYEGQSPATLSIDAAFNASDAPVVPVVPVADAPVNTGSTADLTPDATLVAIFAAAISAYAASAGPQTTAGFVVRRFRRV